MVETGLKPRKSGLDLCNPKHYTLVPHDGSWRYICRCKKLSKYLFCIYFCVAEEVSMLRNNPADSTTNERPQTQTDNPSFHPPFFLLVPVFLLNFSFPLPSYRIQGKKLKVTQNIRKSKSLSHHYCFSTSPPPKAAIVINLWTVFRR